MLIWRNKKQKKAPVKNMVTDIDEVETDDEADDVIVTDTVMMFIWTKSSIRLKRSRNRWAWCSSSLLVTKEVAKHD